MEYPYQSQRFRHLPDGRRVGTVQIGDIFYIQDGVRPFSFPRYVICREPWRVEAWIPRETTSWDVTTRRYKSMRCAGGHLALVRSLRDSRRVAQVADWLLLACEDAGLAWEVHRGSPGLHQEEKARQRDERSHAAALASILPSELGIRARSPE